MLLLNNDEGIHKGDDAYSTARSFMKLLPLHYVQGEGARERERERTNFDCCSDVGGNVL
jgi:hypothetical protein